MSKFSQDLKNGHEQIKKKMRAIGPVRLAILIIAIVVTVLSYVFYEYFFGAKSGWCTTPDTGTQLFDDCLTLIPKLVSCIQSLTILYTIATIVVVILRKTFTKTQRARTVAALICNLINWITAIIAVIIVLSNFGVDTTAIITGAGVLTLVVGLGMQSLIADIVAGLFIVFENEFNVGDIITIDDFYGEVVAIGIRTTKVKCLGNVKIFNNSEIKRVLNHTTDESRVKTLIDVEYGDRLPEIEKIIKEHVGELKIEGATDAVSYDGVAELGASGVTLQFTCHCKEQDYYSVDRALKGAVKNMFDEYGIGIPFPQVVVHKD
ncbi:MAG: mechanosensitive ion channel family protein [Clostridiales bacterium]|nr:mechanosensitive ion channel family protein [Clostridiales bacterium]